MLPMSAALLEGAWPLVAITFVFGTMFGSFLNVCIYRLPADESVVWPGSRCPQCGTHIAWYDNVPLLSWLWLGARCRTCRGPIAIRYPLIEAATGGLAVLAFLHFGPTIHAAVAFAFTAALLLVTVIDIDHRFIPDEVSLPGVAVGLAAAFLPGGITPWDAAMGGLVGGGILWAVAWGYERLRGIEGMGLGDVKLLAMIGAFVGWRAIPGVLIVASIVGSLVGGVVVIVRALGRPGQRVRHRFGTRALLPFVRRALRHTAIPFGPFLALGSLLGLYWPDVLPWPVR
jgi:leader peptidase (prepilin peptidase)/N-methyltransferase